MAMTCAESLKSDNPSVIEITDRWSTILVN